MDFDPFLFIYKAQDFDECLPSNMWNACNGACSTTFPSPSNVCVCVRVCVLPCTLHRFWAKERQQAETSASSQEAE